MADKTFPVPITKDFNKTFDEFNQLCKNRSHNRSDLIRNYIKFWVKAHKIKDPKEKKKLINDFINNIIYKESDLAKSLS